MRLKTRLGIILLIFGLFPLVILFWVGVQNGLSANPSFHTALAIALMGTLLAGMFAPGVMMQIFFNRALQRIREFCGNVKKGRYDVSLEVPNSANDNSEDEDELVALMRDMNWMAHCIKVNDTGLRQALQELRESQAEIEQQKLELTEAFGKLRNLMDNAGQGFLSFGPDLKIVGEYSAECIMIFNQEIADEAIPELLYPGDVQQQVFITALFDKIFCETDDYLRKNFFSLLPEELNFDGSYIHIAYKLIANPSDAKSKEIMLILTDITERRLMEQRIREEQNILSMVVRTVTHYQQFIKAVREFEDFARNELPEILQAGQPAADKVSGIFRSIHTWKGIFAQLGLERLAGNLHQVESRLDKLRSGAGPAGLRELEDCFTEYSSDQLVEWLNEELTLLSGILGEKFFLQEDTVMVESIKLRQLEEKIQTLLSPAQARQLVADLRRLRYKPFKDLLSMYPDYIVNMAVNQGKECQPFSITGGECLIDPARYHDFAKALIHVFRNAVAHGLETSDERLAANKEAAGRIGCKIEENCGRIVIEITDDGRGIESAHIREIAVSKGLYSAEQARALSNDEAVRLILADGFSSTAAASELAGRGVGLFAVQSEAEKLGGSIEVSSQPGRGTKFRFILPRLQELQRLDIRKFGEQVLKQAGHYLQQELNVAPGRIEAVNSNVIPMRNISTFIDVTGSFNGRMMLSADVQLATRLADHYLAGAEGMNYDQQLLESSFAEFFNTIAGNALNILPEWQPEVNIGAPVTIWAEGASAKYGNACIYLWNVATELGQIYFSLISFEREKEDVNGADINC